MSVVVLSSVYGGYDSPIDQPRQTVDADWIMVTDTELDAPGWKTVVERRPHMHPRLAAKVAKCLPWLYTDADTVVWLDAACRLLREDSLEQILQAADGSQLSQIVHPWRDCIYDEAVASRGMLKYEEQPLEEQVQNYRESGHPENGGLWATGLIVRTGEELNMDFGRRWLAEQVRWTYQDQLSQAPILASMGITVHGLPFTLHGSGVFEWLNHRDEA